MYTNVHFLLVAIGAIDISYVHLLWAI